jgi:hypothetical protein
MKKISVIFMVVFVLMMVSFANAQDCGKCPMKQKCITVKKTVKKADVPDPVVYVSKNDKMYHQKDCKIVKNKEGYSEILLSKALKDGAKACTLCNPPVKPTPNQKVTKKEK